MPPRPSTDKLRKGARLGKYRVERKLGDGGFATVYRAYDTLEGQRVALKIPNKSVLDAEAEADFLKEIRLAAKLRHPHIMPLKSADTIDGRYVLAYPLGEKSLADRLQSRLSLAKALEFAEQMTAAVAHAHSERVIHCDIKPENFIITPDGLMLTDFGIAIVALRTVRGSGSGTVGYCAPEQAMGKPSFRSDVFSLGLVIYRMLAGVLPEYPFTWPPPGVERMKRKVHADLLTVLRRAIDLDPKRRYASAAPMLTALRSAARKSLSTGRTAGSARAKATRRRTSTHTSSIGWQEVQWRHYLRLFGKALGGHCPCTSCGAPVAEAMAACPWCGVARKKHKGPTVLPTVCPRCDRGLKADWRYCPWCFGAGFEPESDRPLADKLATGKCANASCDRKQLRPFMRYCPWCRTKVRKKWKLEPASDDHPKSKCPRCACGVAVGFWGWCPWCGKQLDKTLGLHRTKS
ncbi:Serine/threonine-protein kinase StkP [Pseudobythopirellula maris]|uniref:Serine/threonine-protein kinase StkP n=1 Tax=Pseudobythopirellula maris TaxID=2527991 RepID=A0A5C5ZGP2_9BACT|nr:serine/threonine-protein kinase [Pseudobythopirellula maris]TWT86579.1 Serine/threonine-protein kinase StkP [Pseudobythopirellula maris]